LFIMGFLKDGPRLVTELEDAAMQGQGFSKPTFNRARRELHLISFRSPNAPGVPYTIKLPDNPNGAAPPDVSGRTKSFLE
jgi:hypothetical protein